MEKTIKWNFKKYKHFWFFIPKDREYFWGDFFVNKHNDFWANDGDLVRARVLAKSKWKKPEAKIVEIVWKTTQIVEEKKVRWIYISSKADYGFIEYEKGLKSLFVHDRKNNNAVSWDLVEATVSTHGGKEEWSIIKILEDSENIIEWSLMMSDDFGFVKTKKSKDDIFVSAEHLAWASNWDIVQVKIYRSWWRRPEGLIIQKKESD